MITPHFMLVLQRVLLLLVASLICLRIDSDWENLMLLIYTKGISPRDLNRCAAWFVNLAQDRAIIVALGTIALFLLPAVGAILWSQNDVRRHRRHLMLPLMMAFQFVLAAGFLMDSCLRLSATDYLLANYSEEDLIMPAILASCAICVLSEVIMRAMGTSPKHRIQIQHS